MIINETYLKLKHEFKRKPHDLTNRDMFNDILKWIKENISDYEEKIEPVLDYSYSSYKEEYLLQNGCFPVPQAIVSTGGSEGIYVDFKLILDGRKISIGTFKTLDESFHAYMLMGMLSGILTTAAEHYLFCNDENIRTI